MLKKLFSVACLAFLSSYAYADVKFADVFTDHAVLQRDIPVKIWGTADVGEHITVKFQNNTVETTTDESGKWMVTLPAMKALNEGAALIAKGKNEISLNNVVVGEVWICSGQSNMEWPLGRQSGTEEELTGDYSFIRYNRAEHLQAETPQESLKSSGWTLCKDKKQSKCTAVGFHFAVRLHRELGVCVGLIDSNWGGSNINSWMPEETWGLLPELKSQKEKITANRSAGKPSPEGGMFNAMLAPYKNYGIRGAIWYQGCSNAHEGGFYYYKQKAMIQQWRTFWGQGDFPFYWVQLANFKKADSDPNKNPGWAAIREAQTRCLDVPNTGEAVIIDIGEENDIHPRNKYDVGNRLALWALAKNYGKEYVCQSPTFASFKIEGNKVQVVFNHVGGGLVLGKKNGREPMTLDTEGSLNRFAVAGNDNIFHWANAKIIGKDTVELTSPDVPHPVAVRYAYQQNPSGCNLYSAEGLPATPFRTDK